MIRYAGSEDVDMLKQYERHIPTAMLQQCIKEKRVLLMFQDQTFIGWLRDGFFWDELPFMNMLYLLEGYRRQGNGRRLVDFWEKEMGRLGYHYVLTSTQSDEPGQHFYRAVGYQECGSLILPWQPLEMVFIKEL